MTIRKFRLVELNNGMFEVQKAYPSSNPLPFTTCWEAVKEFHSEFEAISYLTKMKEYENEREKRLDGLKVKRIIEI